MKNAQVVVLTAAILLTAALVTGAAPRSVASAPVVQHRVPGFLS
jgi:hypothetical protein